MDHTYSPQGVQRELEAISASNTYYQKILGWVIIDEETEEVWSGSKLGDLQSRIYLYSAAPSGVKEGGQISVQDGERTAKIQAKTISTSTGRKHIAVPVVRAY